jgi:hypothetical protein
MILDFGRYKGRHVSTVPLSYLLWAVEESDFRERNARIWPALAEEARRRLGVVLADQQYNALVDRYNIMLEELFDCRERTKECWELVKTIEVSAATPAAQLKLIRREPPPEQMMVNSVPSFDREPAAVATAMMNDWLSQNIGCPTCQDEIKRFFEESIVALLTAD